VNALQPSHGGTNWNAALKTALGELQSATEPNRELYVISDFAGADLDSVRADLKADQGDVRITFVPVAVEPFVNVSVDAVHVPPGAVLVNEPVRVGVTVRNHATDVPADCALQVELAGDSKGEASLRLAGGATETHEFTLVATHSEAGTGTVRKRIDRLPEDDSRYFVLPVLEQLHVLLVRGAGDARGSFFVSRALSPNRAGHTPLALQETDASRLSSRDLQGTQVVVLASEATLTDSQSQSIADFVGEGGGLFVLAGQRATAEIANRMLLQKLGGARIRGVTQQSSGFVNLDGLRATGILAGFKDTELRTLEAVKFTRYAELLSAEEARPLLKFSGGAPALVEGVHGSGKYMLCAFDGGLDGSDLAVSPMFLPLLHRSVVYLAGEANRQRIESKVGERLEVEVPLQAAERRAAADKNAMELARNFTVTTPSGRKEAVVAREVGKMAVLSYEDTHEPGLYVFEGAGRKIARAVNVDTRESDLRRADLKALAQHLGIDVANTIEDEGSVARAVREARHGKELYKLVVGLVLALLTVELLLSRASRESETA
jgi:hypothetical protein